MTTTTHVRDDAPSAETGTLPQLQLGPYSISRLICGANPFNGGSHLSTFVNRQMVRYYTPERILASLRRCTEVGINCWQSSGGNLDLYRRFREEGGEMHYLSLGLDNPEFSQSPAELAAGGCMAVAHHGEFTDSLFKEGRLDEVRHYLDKVREAGMLTGVSTHMPAVVEAVEERGWDVDFYMTCVYERNRSAEELEALLGQAPIPVSEVYLPEDPPRMYAAMRSTERPCLAFKILAAGRLADHAESVQGAFRQAFSSMKPGDGAIVGIYDEYSDQLAENAALTRRFCAGS